MKKKYALILFYFCVSLCGILIVLFSGTDRILNIGLSLDFAEQIIDAASESVGVLSFITGGRLRTILSFFLSVLVPTVIFLSGFTVFSVSITTISVFLLSASAASAVMQGEYAASTVLLAALSLAAAIVTGAYAAAHRSSMRYAAPDVGKLLTKPETKRYMKQFFTVCAFVLILSCLLSFIPISF